MAGKIPDVDVTPDVAVADEIPDVDVADKIPDVDMNEEIPDVKDKDKDVFIGPKEFVSHMMMTQTKDRLYHQLK